MGDLSIICPDAIAWILERRSAKLAIVTDGADEPVNKKILKRLENGGAEVYRTGLCGTIVVESAGAGSYTVSVER